MLTWTHHQVPVGPFWGGRGEGGRRAVLKPCDRIWHVVAWGPNRPPQVRVAADLESAMRVAEGMVAGRSPVKPRGMRDNETPAPVLVPCTIPDGADGQAIGMSR